MATRWIGLLRAVNVAGRRLAMPDLKAITESLGGKDVRTYLQSGNVVFTASQAAARRLSAALGEHCGFAVPVLLRSAADLDAVVAAQPYTGDPRRELHVTFLERAPADALVTAIDRTRFGTDQFTVHGREVYLLVPGGYGVTKLSNAYLERALETVATTRNWNTVQQLAALSAQT